MLVLTWDFRCLSVAHGSESPKQSCAVLGVSSNVLKVQKALYRHTTTCREALAKGPSRWRYSL